MPVICGDGIWWRCLKWEAAIRRLQKLDKLVAFFMIQMINLDGETSSFTGLRLWSLQCLWLAYCLGWMRNRFRSNPMLLSKQLKLQANHHWLRSEDCHWIWFSKQTELMLVHGAPLELVTAAHLLKFGTTNHLKSQNRYMLISKLCRPWCAPTYQTWTKAGCWL